MSKTDEAIWLLRNGKLQEALAIISKFRIGFSADEKRTIEIAHECLSGNASFYESIGIDTDEYISKAKDIVCMKYCL